MAEPPFAQGLQQEIIMDGIDDLEKLRIKNQSLVLSLEENNRQFQKLLADGQYLREQFSAAQNALNFDQEQLLLKDEKISQLQQIQEEQSHLINNLYQSINHLKNLVEEKQNDNYSKEKTISAQSLLIQDLQEKAEFYKMQHSKTLKNLDEMNKKYDELVSINDFLTNSTKSFVGKDYEDELFSNLLCDDETKQKMTDKKTDVNIGSAHSALVKNNSGNLAQPILVPLKSKNKDRGNEE